MPERPKNDVADVRRSLAQIRKMWGQQTTDAPLLISDAVSDAMSVSSFAFSFVLGHHLQRPSR